MQGIKYIAPFNDHSGYGEASRNYILALHAAGVPLTLSPHCFEPNPPPVGTPAEQDIFRSLLNKKIDFDTVIVHLTPDLTPLYTRQYYDKRLINYTVWETSLLHPDWVKALNNVHEVWVPSQWNVESFKASGVTTQVHKIHHGIDPDLFTGVSPGGFEISGLDKERTFVFYSIMQWNARKNPEGLLRAYYNAFTPEDDVRLVLKAYIGRGLTPVEEVNHIKRMVSHVKQDMQLPYYPKVNLITESMSSSQLRSLQLYGDAYISLPYGEGFGLTFLEAGLAGKPVISTGAGGQLEYLTEDNSFLVPYMWEYVGGMGSFNNWYWGNQQWARPSTVEAAKAMRYVYDNREEAAVRAQKLQARIKNEFSWDRVAKQMLDRLKEL